MDEYSLDDFIKELKALLVKAEKAGHNSDQICEVAEFVLGDGGWDHE